MQLGELQSYYGKFQDAGVHVYAVSVDTPEHNARLKARLGAGYEVLADERGELLDALNLRRKYPLLTLAGVTACLVLSGWCLVRQPSGALLFRLSVPLLLSGLLLFYVFYFSFLHGGQLVSKLRVGDWFPDFTLPDSAGRPVTLAAVVARGPALFLFYRGDW